MFSDVKLEELHRALGLVPGTFDNPADLVDVVDPVPPTEPSFQSQNVVEAEHSNTPSGVVDSFCDEASIPSEDRPMFAKLKQYFSTLSQSDCTE